MKQTGEVESIIEEAEGATEREYVNVPSGGS